MSLPRPGPRMELDPVGTAGALAAVSGLASVGWPFFEGLTAALGALVLLGWWTGERRNREPGGSPGAVAVLAVSGLGWAYFLFAPGPESVARGLILGAAAGFVGWIGRRRPPFGEGS